MSEAKRENTITEIINATIECINELGIDGATIRKIAEYAGINSAAVSYYFQSRDNLIALALEESLNNAFNFDHFEYTESDDYKKVLKKILKHWKDGMIAYPGICYAHFDDIINKKVKNNIVEKRINEFIENVYQIMIKKGLRESDRSFKKLKLIFGAFIATLIMPSTSYPENENDEIEMLAEMLW